MLRAGLRPLCAFVGLRTNSSAPASFSEREKIDIRYAAKEPTFVSGRTQLFSGPPAGYSHVSMIPNRPNLIILLVQLRHDLSFICTSTATHICLWASLLQKKQKIPWYVRDSYFFLCSFLQSGATVLSPGLRHYIRREDLQVFYSNRYWHDSFSLSQLQYLS